MKDEGNGLRSFDEPLAPRANQDSDEWVLVFEDEFEASPLDSSLWFARSGDLVHPSTLNSASPEMAFVEAGSLFVSAIPTPEDERFPYTTGYLETRGLFAQTYGKMDVRVRCRFAPGLWYAIWARPWESAVPEIDIEFLAENTSQVWFVNHWALPPLRADERRDFVTVDGMDITDFHVYSVVWKPDLVEWQIDGKAYKRTTGRGVPREPMFWVLNAWVGGWGGRPSPATIFPANFEIDWFRMYRMKEWPVDPAIRVAKAKSKYKVDEKIRVELADLERSARVEVWDGRDLVTTIEHAPFEIEARRLGTGKHTLAFVGTDGARKATTSIDVVIE
jgi:beta-glucanase (GH16 family)